jgi:uncharacterized membrane protein
MRIEDAQREVRTVFLGSFVGSLVSGAIWLLSAALVTLGQRRAGILALAVGGAFIFPITQLALRAMGRKASLDPANPMNGLAAQVAFTIPLAIPLIAATTLYHGEWFYPAFMVIVGAHYLPFVTLYGMWQFAVLCGALVGGGVAIGMLAPHSWPLGGWVTGVVLIVWGFYARSVVGAEKSAMSGKG